MEDAGTLPTNQPPRRWNLGTDSPLADPLEELPGDVAALFAAIARMPLDALPPDYGDPGGLWLTVRRQDPFDVLLLDPDKDSSADTILVRFRLLWKFWTQKVAIARQGATRTVVRQKYGEHIESYVDNLQWAYDQLTAAGGVAHWRLRTRGDRLRRAWTRISDTVDAVLADGCLEVAESKFLMARASEIGYEREEFARILRDALHSRRFEPEIAPTGHSQAEQLLSVRWATADVWARERTARTATSATSVDRYYVRLASSGQVYGPATADEVYEWIRSARIGNADAVCPVGSPQWNLLAHSRFAHSFTVPASVCRRCGAALTTVVRSRTGGWVVLAIGVATSWLLVGIPLIVIGIVMLISGNNTAWRCVRCGHTT